MDCIMVKTSLGPTLSTIRFRAHVWGLSRRSATSRYDRILLENEGYLYDVQPSREPRGGEQDHYLPRESDGSAIDSGRGHQVLGLAEVQGHPDLSISYLINSTPEYVVKINIIINVHT